MKPGDRFGLLVVREVITAEAAGHVRDGAWCWVRCDCGTRLLVRARHLRFRARQNKTYPASCGCALPVRLRLGIARSAETRRSA